LDLSAISLIIVVEGNNPLTPLKRGHNQRLGDSLELKGGISNNGLVFKDLFYKIVGDELRIGWFTNEGSVHIKAGEQVFVIRGSTTINFKEGDVIQFRVKDDALCEFADENGEPIENVTLSTYSIKFSKENQSLNSISNNEITIIPNPAKEFVNIKYRVFNSCFIKISLYNLIGEKITDIVNQFQLSGKYNSVLNLASIQPGVYICKMFVDGLSINVKKVIITK
jgi:hypothetical protein